MQEPQNAFPEKADGAITDPPVFGAITQAPVFTPPQYTIKDIHDAIPAHCFQPSSLLSIAYVLRDFLFLSISAFLAWTTIPYLPNSISRNLAWVAYSFTQGLFFTGLWELAHECGHGALSKKKWVNHVLGLIIHSFLFVPFHSWRITHAFHHKVTNNIQKDIAFVPDIKEDWVAKRDSRSEFIAKAIDLVEDVPICVLAELIGHQLIAWPTYLIINNFALARMAIVPWWKRSHFYFGGDGPNFKPMHKKDIIVSDIGIAVSALLLWTAVHFFGGWNVMKIYGFPYLWTNHWILTITFLQHTSPKIPYYNNKTHTFLRGAQSAIDRDFGFIGRFIMHGAIETHVLHHHASKIPFYHAKEASDAMDKVMGNYHVRDFKTNYLVAFWKERRSCRFVEEKAGMEGQEIYFFPKKEQ